jgi:hypothetical protein
VKTGFTGSLSNSVRGLVGATTFSATVAQSTQNSHTVNIPAGTTYARFATFDDSVSPSGSDLDMLVYRGSTLVGASGGGTTQEEVNLTNPTAGTYTVVIDGYSTPGGSSQYKLFVWAIGGASAGNLTVTPNPAEAAIGATVNLKAAWSGLAAGVRYLGIVDFKDGATPIGQTVVRIDTPGSVGPTAAPAGAAPATGTASGTASAQPTGSAPAATGVSPGTGITWGSGTK